MTTIQEKVRNIIQDVCGIDIRIPCDLKIKINIDKCKEEVLLDTGRIRLSVLILSEPVKTTYLFGSKGNIYYETTGISSVVYKVEINGVPLLLPSDMKYYDRTYTTTMTGTDIFKHLISVFTPKSER